MSNGDAWFRIGHVTHADDRTGCTAIVLDSLSPAAVDVRGGSPGTRETALLADGMLVGRVDAIVLTGGSAFGLATADGVMRYLREQERGVTTSAGSVPIVPAAVIFDLGVGTQRHPDAEDGYAAASGAVAASIDAGRVGAGTGATVAKLGARPGIDAGLGIATVTTPVGSVAVVIVLNAVGDVVNARTGDWLARAVDPQSAGRSGREIALSGAAEAREAENTSIGVVLIDADVDRRTLSRCCVAAHAALSRCVVPSHTIVDGDTMFAVGRRMGALDALDVLALTSAVEIAVERAIASIFAGRDERVA
ncbi:MAG TPA: P1 family peptidase [Thermomicrobiales bacterium]|nr:P1 family peptidase [Thermomicrobiales bacterium]